LVTALVLAIAATILSFQTTATERTPVPAEMRACAVDADCTYVETACSSCCRYVGINRNFTKAFKDDHHGPACTGYSGPVCECYPRDVAAVCRAGTCVVTDVPRNETE
jgi:hypothetical protein